MNHKQALEAMVRDGKIPPLQPAVEDLARIYGAREVLGALCQFVDSRWRLTADLGSEAFWRLRARILARLYGLWEAHTNRILNKMAGDQK